MPERQNDRNFLEYVQRPQMDLADGQGLRISTIPPISFDIIQSWANVVYQEWPQRHNLPANFPVNQLPATGSFLNRFADASGSSTNPSVMVNLERGLNGYKANVMNTMDDPMALAKFNELANAVDIQSTESALTDLRSVSPILL